MPPLRQSSLPNGPNLLLYRRFTFDNSRIQRGHPPVPHRPALWGGLNARCTEALDPGATITGSEQGSGYCKDWTSPKPGGTSLLSKLSWLNTILILAHL